MGHPNRSRWRATIQQDWPLLVLMVVAGVLAVAVQHNVFPYYSGDADEVVYRFQARMLLDGHFTLSPIQQAPFFSPWLSGPYNGRLVLPFTWPWPAVLAGSQALFGTMLVALGAAAAAGSLFCYLFAREVFGGGDRRPALLAAGLFTFTPFVLTLSGTYLNYEFALAVLLCFGWLTLRGLRSGSGSWLAAAGASWALLTFTRPYDGILAVLPFAGYILWRHGRRVRELAHMVGWLALGAAPVLALMLAANIATTGSALTFPTTAQSGGTAKFFWGKRDVVAHGGRPINFTRHEAISALGQNLWALPTWVLGTYVALALAGWGAWRLRRERPREVGLLLGLMAVFPLGYLLWFASALTADGAWSGIGPHYYLPVVAPLVMLTAGGLMALWTERRALIPVIVVAALVVTGVFLPAKLDTQEFARSVHRSYKGEANRALASTAGRPTLVVLQRFQPDGIGGKWPYFVNRPDLTGERLYALDRGADEADLLRRYPNRSAVRLMARTDPGEPLDHFHLIAKPMTVVSGSAVQLRTHMVNTSGKPVVRIYLAQRGVSASVVLDSASSRNRSYDVTWTIDADGTVSVTGQATSGAPFDHPVRLRSSGTVTVGTSSADRADSLDPDRVERRYDYRRRAGRVDVLTADQEWVRFGAPISHWAAIAVGGQINVQLQPVR